MVFALDEEVLGEPAGQIWFQQLEVRAQDAGVAAPDQGVDAEDFWSWFGGDQVSRFAYIGEADGRFPEILACAGFGVQ